ncbi:type II secretion system F family protein [Nocardioides jiangxiensis]|uniref:Type II secretion system F family protein n=1 Tax=Nocardioides jiangxiensis TaxID=3064524 RepID=A0ABT9B3A0_9ACTN|nr:type II secretion system F family protein [Nocardioides sp. WY-20]MDO7869289.1 type II secretion system F family protein [Nocardioides sp. WY-20]
MRRVLLATLACCAVLAPGQARAADAPATVSHIEAHDGTLDLLVSVPAGAHIDLPGVSVTVDGAAADTEASLAGSASAVTIRRTTVLAMDTSESMKGARFAAARAAAKSYLASVPADVAVGIVTFDRSVHALLAPTTDRAAANRAVDGLELAHGTVLYDGIKAAVKQLGTEGQRTVLLLSDGRNTNRTTLSSVTSAVSAAKVSLDAVALDQSASDLGALRALTHAGKGQLVPADAAAVGKAFAAEAAVLARQVQVTVKVPASVTATEADVAVALPVSGGSTLHATTYAVVRDRGVTPTKAAYQLKEATHALQLPPGVLYGGLAAFGLGIAVLLAGVLSMAGGDRGLRSVEQRIAAYGPGAVLHKVQAKSESAFNLDQAKEAAASMLHRNKGLEARIEQRLEAGGSALKPAEWLLLHGVIAMLAGLVGLMLGGGSLLLLLVGLGLGVALPWWWLGRKQKKRVQAFNSGLADTLQLIAGSLSAGMSLAQAIDAVVNEGNEPIAGEFKRVLIESRLGVPLEIALEGIAQRIESVDFAWVVMAIRIQREVGGNLAELLTTVAATLRERDYLRRQVQTLSAEGRLSAYILIALPIAMAAYLFLTRRSFLAPLYTTGLGYLMIAGCIVLLTLGWVTMSKIVKVEV